jgi:hypothetical protein
VNIALTSQRNGDLYGVNLSPARKENRGETFLVFSGAAHPPPSPHPKNVMYSSCECLEKFAKMFETTVRLLLTVYFIII